MVVMAEGSERLVFLVSGLVYSPERCGMGHCNNLIFEISSLIL